MSNKEAYLPCSLEQTQQFLGVKCLLTFQLALVHREELQENSLEQVKLSVSWLRELTVIYGHCTVPATSGNQMGESAVY